MTKHQLNIRMAIMIIIANNYIRVHHFEIHTNANSIQPLNTLYFFPYITLVEEVPKQDQVR